MTLEVFGSDSISGQLMPLSTDIVLQLSHFLIFFNFFVFCFPLSKNRILETLENFYLGMSEKKGGGHGNCDCTIIFCE